MKILLDTHFLLWSFIDTSKIKPPIQSQLLEDDNEIFYSQASLWEISIKYNTGKLKLEGMKPEEFFEEVENSFLTCKRLENEELISFYQLPIQHRDPFDRIMIWQCIKSNMVFLSSDGLISEYRQFGLKTLI